MRHVETRDPNSSIAIILRLWWEKILSPSFVSLFWGKECELKRFTECFFLVEAVRDKNIVIRFQRAERFESLTLK